MMIICISYECHGHSNSKVRFSIFNLLADKKHSFELKKNWSKRSFLFQYTLTVLFRQILN